MPLLVLVNRLKFKNLKFNLAFVDCAFSHAAPAVWNSLPLDIVSDLSCVATFKRLVKTELYNRAYLRWLVTTRNYDSSLVNDLTCIINHVIIKQKVTVYSEGQEMWMVYRWQVTDNWLQTGDGDVEQHMNISWIVYWNDSSRMVTNRWCHVDGFLWSWRQSHTAHMECPVTKLETTDIYVTL